MEQLSNKELGFLLVYWGKCQLQLSGINNSKLLIEEWVWIDQLIQHIILQGILCPNLLRLRPKSSDKQERLENITNFRKNFSLQDKIMQIQWENKVILVRANKSHQIQEEVSQFRSLKGNKLDQVEARMGFNRISVLVLKFYQIVQSKVWKHMILLLGTIESTMLLLGNNKTDVSYRVIYFRFSL